MRIAEIVLTIALEEDLDLLDEPESDERMGELITEDLESFASQWGEVQKLKVVVAEAAAPPKRARKIKRSA